MPKFRAITQHTSIFPVRSLPLPYRSLMPRHTDQTALQTSVIFVSVPIPKVLKDLATEACNLTGPAMHSLVHPSVHPLERLEQQQQPGEDNCRKEAGEVEEVELHISLSRELYLRADRRETLASEVRKVVGQFGRSVMLLTSALLVSS